MEVMEVVGSWVGVATTCIAEMLGLATRAEVIELRRRVDELQAIVRAPDDGELPARRASLPPNMKNSIARAGAALAGVRTSSRSKIAAPDDPDSGALRPEGR